MSRRTDRAAEEAATRASEAARVLQSRQQESKAEKAEAVEPRPDPAPERDRKNDLPEEKIDQLRKSNPRDSAMDSILKARGEVDDEPKDEPKAEVDPKPEAPNKAADKPAEAPAAEAPVEQKTVLVKVDGEEFQAPEEEVEAAGGVRPYQMAKAAENRLKKAQEMLAEAQKSRFDIGELVQAIRRQPTEPEKPKESDEQFIASKMDVIRYGNPEDAAKAQVEIINRLQKPSVDPDAIVARAQMKIEHDNAVRSFDKEFEDVVKQPLLLKLCLALREDELAKHKKENPNRPVDWHSFYRTIGIQVRSVAGRQSQPASASAETGGNPSQASDKEARKASIVNLPTAAARAELPKEEKPLTPEQERAQTLSELRNRAGRG